MAVSGRLRLPADRAAHQLCGDPAIPCTSKNGFASLWFEPREHYDRAAMRDTLRQIMLENFVEAAIPDSASPEEVPAAVREFGRLVQQRVVIRQCPLSGRTMRHSPGRAGRTEGA